MIVLYGFLEGDTMGLVVFAEPTTRASELAAKLQQAARVRVAPGTKVKVVFAGRELIPSITVADAGIEALDRFDVVRA